MSRSLSRSLLRASFLLAFLASLALMSVAPASAETPTAVAERLADDGVYLAAGNSDYDEAALATVVARARDLGLRMVVIAPDDPQPDNNAFALRVRQLVEADVTLSFGPDGTLGASVTEDYKDAFPRSLAAARDTEPAEAAAEVFLTELVTTPDRSVPGTISTIVRGVVVLLLVLVLAAAAEQLLRRSRRDSATKA
jgi:hypothetical protein